MAKSSHMYQNSLKSEIILNKIEKTFKKTYTELKSFIHYCNHVCKMNTKSSMMDSIDDSKHTAPIDLPFPAEILEIITANLGEKDLRNLIKVGNERIQNFANRALKKLSLKQYKISNLFHRTISLNTSYSIKLLT